LGCSNFFRYHHNATVKDYSNRFGYDTEVLIQTLKQTDSYSRNRKSKKEVSEDNFLMEALFDLDRKGMTDTLYKQQKTQKESSYLSKNSIQIYFLNALQRSYDDLKRIIEEYLDDDEPDREHNYELYPLEDPYRLMLEMIGLFNNGYSLNEIIKNIEENIPNKEVPSKIVELVNLLNTLRDRKICPFCGKEINLNENSEFDFCEFCGNIFDRNSLDLIKVETKEELLTSFKEIQLNSIK